MNLEEARREVLDTPADFPHAADDYLDLLAEELLAERRAMADAAPTKLARALIERGRTRAELAAALGVSTTAVGYWASGEKPLPDGRIDEVAAYLVMAPWGRAKPLPEASTLSDTPGELSYFGWVLEYVVMIAPSSPSYHAVATRLGVTKAKLFKWTQGLEEVPEDAVEAFVRAYVPGIELSPRS